MYEAGVQKLHVVRFLQKHQIKIEAILNTFQQGVYEEIPIFRFDDFLCANPDPERAPDCETTLCFSNSDGATNLSHVADEKLSHGCRIEVVTIDDTICEPITYMTMSINGSELKRFMERYSRS